MERSSLRVTGTVTAGESNTTIAGIMAGIVISTTTDRAHARININN